jgi:hypothetical protein
MDENECRLGIQSVEIDVHEISRSYLMIVPCNRLDRQHSAPVHICQDQSSVALCIPMHTALPKMNNRLLDNTLR